MSQNENHSSLPIDSRDRIEGWRLSSEAVLDGLQRASERAGVEVLVPYATRRTFVTTLLEAGAPPRGEPPGGHASVEMMKLYDRRGEDAKNRAVERLGP